MEYCKLSDYDYHLPPELIAQEPLSQRDRSRMMVIDRRRTSREDASFFQLPSYLDAGDLLVLNNTRVIPARLKGTIRGKAAAAEILLLHKLDNGHWVAMVNPGKKLKPGARVYLEYGVEAEITGYSDQGLRSVRFFAPEPFEEMLPRLGAVPLPPYIRQEIRDPDQYQTIYAVESGSAAAPTAGFHFTDAVFNALEVRGIGRTFITLHIGPGTFQPVKSGDIRNHEMHREYFRLDEATAALLNQTRRAGGKIVAVGSTACRVLETVVDEEGLFKSEESWTDLFIYPGFRFRAVETMLTNFHLPRSTLLMLVAAFAGYDQIMSAYLEAVEKQYRFFSFGDCMLIL